MLKEDMIVEKCQYKDYKIKPVAVYSQNSREWVLIDIACSLYGFTLVPIYDTLGQEAIEVMFEDTEVPVIFLTVKHIKDMAKRAKEGAFPHLKHFVVMDEHNLTSEIEAEFGDYKWFKMTDIIEVGAKNVAEYPEVTPEEVLFFSYTSGTTGRPKGAMIT